MIKNLVKCTTFGSTCCTLNKMSLGPSMRTLGLRNGDSAKPISTVRQLFIAFLLLGTYVLLFLSLLAVFKCSISSRCFILWPSRECCWRKKITLGILLPFPRIL